MHCRRAPRCAPRPGADDLVDRGFHERGGDPLRPDNDQGRGGHEIESPTSCLRFLDRDRCGWLATRRYPGGVVVRFVLGAQLLRGSVVQKVIASTELPVVRGWARLGHGRKSTLIAMRSSIAR